MVEWERSREDARRASEKTVAVPIPGGKGKDKPAEVADRTERTREVRGRLGDVSYLAEARAAMADQRKILGLDAPTRHKIEGKVAVESEAEAERRRELEERAAGMSDAELDHFEQAYARLTGRGDGLAGFLHGGEGSAN